MGAEIAEGLRLMVVGMGAVFCFLLLMVGMMHVSSAICLRLSPLPAEEPESSSATVESRDDETSRVAAIATAIRDRWPG